MENSIEEDIKNAEHFIKSIKTDKEYKEDGWHGYYNKEIVELARILEHILSDYKKVLKMNEVLLKENEKLKAKWDKDTHKLQNELDLTNADKINNYIPVQKVKDKIEEIQEDKTSKYYYMFLEDRDLEYTVKILQELLEGEE